MHVEKLLASVRDQLPFNEIVIAGTSSDFKRSFWIPHSNGKKIWIGVEAMSRATALTQDPIGYVISGQESADELVSFSRSAHTEALRLRRGGGLLERRPWGARSGSSSTGCANTVFRYRAASEKTQRRSGTFEMPIRSWPSPSFISPLKSEVVVGAYQQDVGGVVTALGVSYWPALEGREWSRSMFHEFDGHPNATGYDQISSYVQEVLGLGQP